MPEKVDPRAFYVVWSPQSGPPVVRIATFDEARVAALRLGSKFPEKDFFVLRSCWGKMGQPAAEAGPSGEDIPDDSGEKVAPKEDRA